jgi:hypothetical protein
MVNNWSSYNENSETGKAAFFVDQKYVASKGEGRQTARPRAVASQWRTPPQGHAPSCCEAPRDLSKPSRR